VYNTARQTKLLLNVLQRNIQNDEEKSTLQNVLSEQQFAANKVHVARSKQTSGNY